MQIVKSKPQEELPPSLPRKNFCKTGRRFQRSKEFSRSLSKHVCEDIIARVTSTSFIRTIRTFRGMEERQIHEHAPSIFSRRILVRSFFDPKQAKTALPPVKWVDACYSFKLVQTYCFRNIRREQYGSIISQTKGGG